MALYLCQNFVSAQYLENQLVDFHKNLYIVHSSWQDLAWDCYTSFFANLYKSNGPWFMPKFCFHSISWELTDIFFTKFIFAVILTRPSLGLSHIILCIFVPELWPLIYAKILFPFNILRTNAQNFTKFYICVHIDKIYFEIVTHHFSHICTRVMVLDLLQNFVSTQYLGNKWTDFDQTLYNYLYWQDLRWDC